jgi:hypothetical protein
MMLAVEVERDATCASAALDKAVARVRTARDADRFMRVLLVTER